MVNRRSFKWFVSAHKVRRTTRRRATAGGTAWAHQALRPKSCSRKIQLRHTRPALTVVTAACAFLATAYPGTASEAKRDAAKQLDQRRLTELMKGGRRFRDLPISDYGPVTRLEYFFADGKYMGCADRGVVEGTYELHNGELCNISGNHRFCRVIIRFPTGFRQQRRLDEGPPEPIHSVEIAPIPKGENCKNKGD